MTCDDADLLLAAEAVASLDASDRAPLEDHVTRCERCRHASREYRTGAALLALAAPPVEPPQALRTRLMAQVYAEAAPAPAPAPVPAAGPPRPTVRDRAAALWRHVPASRGLTLGAVAGAAAALLTAWGLASHGGGAAPQSLSVAVRGTVEAPAARGALTYDSTAHQAVLSVRGLPPPATSGATGDRRVYEVWVISADGRPEPVAFLDQGPDGRTWSAAIGSVTGGTTVAATSEPAGGSLLPTGPAVVEVAVPRAWR